MTLTKFISRWAIILIIGLAIKMWFIIPIAIVLFIFYRIRKKNIERRGVIM